jgi:hypothetical protein
VTPDAPLSILFVFADPGRIRYFEPALDELARRGDRVHAAIERPRERIPGQLRFIEELAARSELVSYDAPGKLAQTEWQSMSRSLRLALDYLHYLQPAFDDAPDFRRRAAADAPAAIVRLAQLPLVRTRLLRRGLARMLLSLESSIPPNPSIVDYLRARRPDVVLVTPFFWFGAGQTDWVRAARSLGVRVGACLFSWDNLTSKGSVCEVPDFLTVWNEAQVVEASRLHGVPEDRIVVTGAQNWDHWFAWKPGRTREEFCAVVGVSPERPIVLYVESSGYVGGEPEFVREWVTEMRAHRGERTPQASVVVRPHPQTEGGEWAAARLDRLDDVAVWPAAGQVPLDTASRRDFYDSIYHADAVVGINTSAFIESAIVGRPCLSIRLDRFRKGQTSTVHFHHLLEENGGPLRLARSLDEHFDQLDAALADPRVAADQAAAFVRSFVRPLGSDVPAGSLFADAVERAAVGERWPASARSRRVVRRLLAPVVHHRARTARAASPALADDAGPR